MDSVATVHVVQSLVLGRTSGPRVASVDERVLFEEML